MWRYLQRVPTTHLFLSEKTLTRNLQKHTILYASVVWILHPMFSLNRDLLNTDKCPYYSKRPPEYSLRSPVNLLPRIKNCNISECFRISQSTSTPKKLHRVLRPQRSTGTGGTGEWLKHFPSVLVAWFDLPTPRWKDPQHQAVMHIL